MRRRRGCARDQPMTALQQPQWGGRSRQGLLTPRQKAEVGAALLRNPLNVSNGNYGEAYCRAVPFSFEFSRSFLGECHDPASGCGWFIALYKLCEWAGVPPGTRFWASVGDTKLPSWWPWTEIVVKARWVGGPGLVAPYIIAGCSDDGEGGGDMLGCIAKHIREMEGLREEASNVRCKGHAITTTPKT